MAEQQAPAGWYPAEGNQVRYWDGQSWTEHVHDVAPGIAMEQPKASTKPSVSRLRNAAATAAASMTSDDDDLPQGTLWSATGRNLGKFITGRYRLDAAFLYYSKGALRTQWQQVYVSSIVDVDVRQSVTQKSRGLFTVGVRLHDRPSFTMDDIPDGPTAQRIITKAAIEARLALEQRSIRIDGQRHEATNSVRQDVRVESTAGHAVLPQTVAGTAIPQQAPLPPETAATSALEPAALGYGSSVSAPTPTDYIGHLRELGELRDAGILTEDEFAAKKAEILARL